MNNIATCSTVETLDKNDIFSFWPMAEYAPRESQIQVLNWIKSLPPHIKYILCEVPVGGGKSPLALNISGWFAKNLGNAYILTPQKVLQKQYEDSFNAKLLHSVYGKANYTCETKSTNCEIGSEIKPRCEECPHKSAILKMQYAPNVVLNYTLAFLMFKYLADETVIKKRDLIVFDEAHTIETHLTEFNSISISEYRCKIIGNIIFRQFSNMKSAIEWTKETYMPALINKIKKLNSVTQDIIERCSQEGVTPSKDEIASIALLKELTNHREMLSEQILTPSYDSVNEDYVMVNEGKTVFKFKELYGKRNFKRFVEPMAEKFLFMSSTILDKDAFCEDLGLDPNQAAFISLDSEFHVDNRPILYMPTTKMSFGWDKPERKKETNLLLKKIVMLCNEMHPDDSGVIHAGSFQIAKWLVDNLENKIPHKIMHHNPSSGFSRDEVLSEFQELDGVPKLLISPSVTEGLDLKGDKGRFAIFAKVPFPYIADAWVKKRMSLSDSWYKRQALIAMIQGGGRIVRSSDDWGHVYILDSSFGYLLQQSKNMIPKWWNDSITVI